MKLALASLAALFVALAVASSCSINHRSDALACTTQSDCDEGRTCTNGYCLQTGGPPQDGGTDGRPGDGPRPDMSEPPPDAQECPPGCTTCGDGKQCNIDCSIDSCSSEIECPAGWNCNIQCNVANACRQGIDCISAESCTVTCTGASSCRDVTCGEGQCKVQCMGLNSCRDTDCSESCACDVTCANGAACAETSCPTGCGAGPGRCSSTIAPELCSTCE